MENTEKHYIRCLLFTIIKKFDKVEIGTAETLKEKQRTLDATVTASGSVT